MNTTTDKLNRLTETKNAIKTAITAKGGAVNDAMPFREYANAIMGIPQEGGESVEKLEVIDAIFDIATMSITSMSHTHAQIKEFINNGKTVFFRANAGITYTFGSLVFHNLVTDRIGFQLMIQEDFGQGYMLYYFNVIVYPDDSINVTPYVVNLTGMGGNP